VKGAQRHEILAAAAGYVLLLSDRGGGADTLQILRSLGGFLGECKWGLWTSYDKSIDDLPTFSAEQGGSSTSAMSRGKM
jgi:hypothetical protein